MHSIVRRSDIGRQRFTHPTGSTINKLCMRKSPLCLNDTSNPARVIPTMVNEGTFTLLAFVVIWESSRQLLVPRWVLIGIFPWLKHCCRETPLLDDALVDLMGGWDRKGEIRSKHAQTRTAVNQQEKDGERDCLKRLYDSDTSMRLRSKNVVRLFVVAVFYSSAREVELYSSHSWPWAAEDDSNTLYSTHSTCYR